MMQIDDPGSALAALNDSEDRSEFLPHKTLIATGLSAAFGAVAAATTGADAILCATAAGFFTIAGNITASVGERRQREFVSYLHDEFLRRSVTPEMLEEKLKSRDENFHELLAEAVVRASEAKSAERVCRIAHLLTAFIFSPNSPQVEEARVMLEIAGNLFDMDAFVLGRMRDEMHADIERRQGHPELNDIVAAWRKLREAHSEFREGTINSSCARLQSHGLVMRVEPGMGQFDLQTYVYAITEFGIRFYQWCLKDLN